MTVNDAVLVPVPAAVVTATGPVVAPAGTVAVIWVPEVDGERRRRAVEGHRGRAGEPGAGDAHRRPGRAPR